MHRGSSKGAAVAAAPETLPPSVPPPPVRVEFTIARGRPSPPVVLELPPGTTLRAALRRLGQPPEGCAVLDGPDPVPLDTPLDAPRRLTVVPTFSGG